MKLLLDTHVLLWWLADDRRLTARGRQWIAQADQTVFVSAASGWEIAIKRALGKLQAPSNLAAMLVENQFAELPIRIAHAEQAARLPRIHEDLFDRMLIAQAMHENLILLTHDKQLAGYPVETLIL